MFQVPPAMVNAGLVQFPLCCTSGTRTVGGPTAAGAVVVDVEPDPAAVVVGDDPAAVVAVAPPATVVVEAPPAAVVGVEPAAPAVVEDDPAAGGSLYVPPEPVLVPEAGPALPLNHMPASAAMTATTASCQVFQARRSFILSSPTSGVYSAERRGSAGGPEGGAPTGGTGCCIAGGRPFGPIGACPYDGTGPP